MTNPEAPKAGEPNEAALTAERTLSEQLTKQFAFLADQIEIQRARRIWIKVPLAELHAVLLFLKDTLGFDTLSTITGTDEGADLGYLYHLANEHGILATLMTLAPKDGLGPSTVTPYFPLAELYEREIIDLLGAKIQGLPEGNRYPLPDGWPEGQYPLRKDWKPEGSMSPKEK
jgi:membrane-bound hydrogenase subunit beta